MWKMAKTLSFRHFETELRLSIDKNTNIPKVETIDDSRIYFSKCSKWKDFAIVRGFENQQVLVVCKSCLDEAQIKSLQHINSRLAKKQWKRTIKNLNKHIDMIFYLQWVSNCKLNRTLKIA